MTETATVPLKLLVGVMFSPAVLVARTPKIVVVFDEIDCTGETPPRDTVIEPADMPVVVMLN